jgi:hypothetical protein
MSHLLSNTIKAYARRAIKSFGSRLLHPIHGRGVLHRSNIISNLKGYMAACWPPEAIGGNHVYGFV